MQKCIVFFFLVGGGGGGGGVDTLKYKTKLSLILTIFPRVVLSLNTYLRDKLQTSLYTRRINNYSFVYYLLS